MSGQSTQSFDCIVIGSSPIAMIEALYRRLQGMSCLVVDAADRIGGAWTVTDFHHFEGVETGPHYIGSYSATHNFLDRLGISMQRLSPEGEYVLQDRFLHMQSIPYTKRWVKAYADGINSNTSVQKLKRYIAYILEAGRRTLRLESDPKTLKYPMGGLRGMMNRLEYLLEASGVTVRCDTWLDEVEVDTPRRRVRVKLNGCPATCQTLVMTSCTQLDRISVNGSTVEIPTPRHQFLQVQILVSHTPRKPFSIIYFPKRHPLAAMISDITEYTLSTGHSDDHRVFAARVPDNAPQTDETVEQIIQFLKRRQYLEQGAHIVDYNWILYDIPYRDRPDMDKIDCLFEGLVQGLYTVSMGSAIASEIERWIPVMGDFLDSINETGPTTVSTY